MSQDIVLVSNASMDLYPGNKLSDFSVRLPQPLSFDASYRVAVTRISFTKSYFNFNINFGAGAITFVIISETGTPYASSDQHEEHKGPACETNARILPGHYTPESFIDMINAQVKRYIKFNGDQKLKSYVNYKLVNGFLEIEPGLFETAAGAKVKWEMHFAPEVKQILGIASEDKRPVFLNQGLTDLMVYCDLCYPSIVGDKNCELLAILNGQTDKPYGSHCSEIFEDPWFHRLAKHSFQTIRVFIRDDAGRPLPFKFGRVNLRLTFKREDAV